MLQKLIDYLENIQMSILSPSYSLLNTSSCSLEHAYKFHLNFVLRNHYCTNQKNKFNRCTKLQFTFSHLHTIHQFLFYPTGENCFLPINFNFGQVHLFHKENEPLKEEIRKNYYRN